MSHWNPHSKFDYQEWLRQQVAKRAREALDARDAAFAEKHAETSLEELAHYLRMAARLLNSASAAGRRLVRLRICVRRYACPSSSTRPGTTGRKRCRSRW